MNSDENEEIKFKLLDKDLPMEVKTSLQSKLFMCCTECNKDTPHTIATTIHKEELKSNPKYRYKVLATHNTQCLMCGVSESLDVILKKCKTYIEKDS